MIHYTCKSKYVIIIGFGDIMENNNKKIKVTLAGKYRGSIFDRILMLKKELMDQGIDVLYPPEGNMSDDNYGFFSTDKRTGNDSEDFGFAEINFLHKTLRMCDAIIFCNYDGYLGKTTNELFFFASLIVSSYNEDMSKYYNVSKDYIPIYLLEEVDIESLRSPDELADLASLLEYGMKKGLIKVGIEKFYDDFKISQDLKMETRNKQRKNTIK